MVKSTQKLIDIPKNQVKFVARTWLYPNQMPSDYITSKEFKSVLCNKSGLFNNMSSFIDKSNFVNRCLDSVMTNDKNKEKFNSLFLAFNNLKEQCYELSYFELLNNISTINLCFTEFVRFYNDIALDDHFYEIIQDFNYLSNIPLNIDGNKTIAEFRKSNDEARRKMFGSNKPDITNNMNISIDIEKMMKGIIPQ